MLFLEHFGVTDAGKVRQNNEDSLLVGDGRDETLFVVADGIGGFEAGEVASAIAIEVLRDLEPGGSIEEAIHEANERILASAGEKEQNSGMGTTVVAVRFSGNQSNPLAEVAHVGDSRAYLLRDGHMEPVTEDHSLVAELVRSGDLTRAQASRHPQKNLITRALGAEESVEVDTSTLQVRAGDRFLLCSDGLSDMVAEERIEEILTESSEEPETPSRRLLTEALEAGGSDNVTVVVIDVKEHNPQEDRSGGTREMEAVPPPAESSTNLEQTGGSGEAGNSRRERRNPSRTSGRSSGGRSGKRREKERSGFVRDFRRFVSGAAMVLVVLLLLSPVYFWGSSRYFLDFNGGDVVAYRGLPYAPLGIELNEEWRRTNIGRDQIKGPYRERVQNHKLYNRQEAEKLLQDIRS